MVDEELHRQVNMEINLNERNWANELVLVKLDPRIRLNVPHHSFLLSLWRHCPPESACQVSTGA